MLLDELIRRSERKEGETKNEKAKISRERRLMWMKMPKDEKEGSTVSKLIVYNNRQMRRKSS